MENWLKIAEDILKNEGTSFVRTIYEADSARVAVIMFCKNSEEYNRFKMETMREEGLDAETIEFLRESDPADRERMRKIARLNYLKKEQEKLEQELNESS